MPVERSGLTSCFDGAWQVSGRKNLESSLRQLEREKALLQHKSLESHRKAESEADRKRCLENEGDTHTHTPVLLHLTRHDFISLESCLNLQNLSRRFRQA